MTDEQLELNLKELVREERRITAEILSLINLAEERRIPLERGFASTFDWLTRGLGYSESAAYRRLDAARLVRKVPEAIAKLRSGEVNLSTLGRTRSVIRACERASGAPMPARTQAELIRAIENKSTAEAERTLFELVPEAASAVPPERTVRLNATLERVSLNMSAEDMANLAWAKDFFSHAMPHATAGDVFSRLLREFRDRMSTSAAKKRRVKGQRLSCTYHDSASGRTCGSTYQVEEDHIVPRALGGTDHPPNMRPLCRQHNKLVAEQWLGRAWANSWRRKRMRVTEPPGVQT